LSCEQCGKVLGDVYSTEDRSAIPAVVAIALWPELRQRIKWHATHCPVALGRGANQSQQ
jgi:hypothetical protein